MLTDVRWRASILIALLVASGACTVSGPESDLEAARRRWADRGPTSYEMVVGPECFCGEAVTARVLVTVRQREVVSRHYVSSGASVDSRWDAAFPDVPGLFDLIEDAIDRKAARVSASYDPQLGYPMRIDIDYRRDYVDDEVTYLVGAWRPL
jgi:hypothetical protein